MHRFLIDENLSFRLVKELSIQDFSPIHVTQIQLNNSLDAMIWNYAKNNGCAIITKDIDFLHMSTMYGCPPKIIKLNCGNRTTDFIINLIIKHKVNIIAFMDSADNCYMEIL